MNEETIHYLNDLNRDFYAQIAGEFDQTRATAWQGWTQLPPYLPPAPFRALDVGCGNARFATFLAQNYPNQAFSYDGIDNSAALLERAQIALDAHPQITATLTLQDIVEQPLASGAYDLVVAFGVLHHIPSYRQRQNFVRMLADQLAPNGVLIYTEWRFYEFERFKARTVSAPSNVQLEAGDYLLNWGRKTAREGDPLRYCHYVDDAESSALIEASTLKLITTFRADGHQGATNNYVVLTRR